MTMPDEGAGGGSNEPTPDEASARPTGSSGQTPASLDGFSPGGAKEYEKISQEYLIALAETSRAVALRKNADVASPFHVQVAAETLGGDRGRTAQRLGEIGTLLIGGGLSYLGTVIYGSSYTFKNSLIVFIPLLIGCILYAYRLARG
jgi:hypothetical protein